MPKGKKKQDAAAFAGDTHIGAIVDRSGSMSGIMDEMRSGFNSWLDTVAGSAPNARITTTLFDTDVITLDNDAVAANATRLSDGNYRPGGGTALNDTIMSCLAILEAKVKPGDRALVVVITDGQENSSRNFGIQNGGTARVKERITALEARGNWTFTYLSASPTAFADAVGYGTQLGSTQTFVATSAGTQTAWRSASVSTETYLSSPLPSTASFYTPETPAPEDES